MIPSLKFTPEDAERRRVLFERRGTLLITRTRKLAYVGQVFYSSDFGYVALVELEQVKWLDVYKDYCYEEGHICWESYYEQLLCLDSAYVWVHKFIKLNGLEDLPHV